MQMACINEIRNKIKQQPATLLVLALLCIIAVIALPVYASPGLSSVCELVVIAVPNISGNPGNPGNPENPGNSLPLAGTVAWILPVVFAITGVVVAFALRQRVMLAVIILIMTTFGTLVLAQVMNQLW